MKFQEWLLNYIKGRQIEINDLKFITVEAKTEEELMYHIQITHPNVWEEYKKEATTYGV